jgi:SulP family sulfate permease
MADVDVPAGEEQPGQADLREAVERYARRRLPRGKWLGRDAVAGLNGSLASVPDGMASGLLAGVNPVFGLYACTVGPIAGGIFSSTALMVVTTTSAASLGAGQALGDIEGVERSNALFLMALLIGASQVVFGLLGLGRLTRFVSYSVMTGFVAGIAILTTMTQLPTITGYEPSGGNNVVKTLDLLAHAGQIDLRVVGVAALALALALALRRTIVGHLAPLVAITVPSLLVILFGVQGVDLVRDVGDIPSGVPLPSLPSLEGLSADVLTGALAVSVVILVQGTGVSQSVPNPDGSRRSVSGDFIGQGAANLAAGLFRGLPVGGSLSTTALSVLSGARSRWTAIFAGLWMGVIVIALSGLVSEIAMPTLAAVLIIATLSTIKPRDLRSVWHAGWPSISASLTTFVSTLLLPIQLAVGIGVALSGILYLYEAAADVSVAELVERSDGQIEERPPDDQLRSNDVTVLAIRGHLFFAGARTLERLLPSVEGSTNAAVVIRLRGQTRIGATLVDVLAGYAQKLEDENGRLYFSGLSKAVNDRLRRSGRLGVDDDGRTSEATAILGESTCEAYARARRWVDRQGDDGEPEQDGRADEAT